MLEMRERLLTLPVVACVLALCAGPVFAAFTVEIVKPADDPFELEVGEPELIEVGNGLEEQQLPSDEVGFEWDFGDGSDPISGNNLVYEYEQTGNYTVTVSATYAAQQAQDTATAQVVAEGQGTKPKNKILITVPKNTEPPL